MHRRLVILVSLLFTGPLIVSALLWRPSGAAQERAARGAAKESGTRLLQGTISCATSVCHGGADIGQRRSEFTTWVASDPHARAYDTLHSATSIQIAKNLWNGRKLAHEERRCLVCHVSADFDLAQPTITARPNFRKEDGVGCESCHGAAQDWLTPHYQSGWKNSTSKQKLDAGLKDTKDLAGRASVCVGCHVGSAKGQVDHDLIAAGHPALRFEFAAYFANLPAHWNVNDDKKRHPDFETRAWAVGQLVSSACALELLAHRADSADAIEEPIKKVWPEFAEMDCFSCHHDLQGASWRRGKEHLQGRKLGSVSGGNWYYAMLPDVLTVAKPAKWDQTLADVQQMAKRRDDANVWFRAKERGELQQPARNLATALRDLARAPLRAPTNDWQDRLLKTRPADRSWDEAAQRYLALMAIQQARKDANEATGELAERIGTLRKEVAYGAGEHSPRAFVPAAVKK